MAIPSLDRVNELLSYDPLTGALTWRVDRGNRINRIKAGSPAGWIEKNGSPAGYLRIMIDGVAYMAHDLAWFIMKGEWPILDVDHENTERADNRWLNLREATRSQNKANGKLYKDSKTGFKGVSFRKKNGKYAAVVVKNYKHHFCGYFDTAEAAHQAYIAKATELFGEFARAG